MSHFTDVASYAMLGGIFVTTFAGMVYDWQKRIYKGKYISLTVYSVKMFWYGKYILF